MKNLLALNYWVMGGFDAQTDICTAIKQAKEYGLDAIEFTFGEIIKEDITDSELEEIRKCAEENNIKLKTLATGFYWGCSFSSDDKADRKRAIEFTIKYLKAASKLGAESILVVPGAVEVPWEENSPVIDYALVWERSIKVLKELAPLAEELKVNIAVENVWNNFLLSPIEMKHYLDEIDSLYVGAYFDVGNVVRVGVPEHWIKILGKRIKAIHIKNFKREDACGGLHGFGDNLLEGDINFDNVKAALTEINYQGPITAEMIPFSRLPNLILPDEPLAKATAKRLIEIFRGKVLG
jgi:hexulose-6-phosphate isomerase